MIDIDRVREKHLMAIYRNIGPSSVERRIGLCCRMLRVNIPNYSSREEMNAVLRSIEDLYCLFAEIDVFELID